MRSVLLFKSLQKLMFIRKLIKSITNYMELITTRDAISCAVTQDMQHFLETEISLLHLQQISSFPYLEPHKYITHHPIHFLQDSS
jgi:hypothetical protein